MKLNNHLIISINVDQLTKNANPRKKQSLHTKLSLKRLFIIVLEVDYSIKTPCCLFLVASEEGHQRHLVECEHGGEKHEHHHHHHHHGESHGHHGMQT